MPLFYDFGGQDVCLMGHLGCLEIILDYVVDKLIRPLFKLFHHHDDLLIQVHFVLLSRCQQDNLFLECSELYF